MIGRRAAVRIAAVAVPAAWLTLLSPAQGFQKFTPFLVDLPGWTGNKPDGMAMQCPAPARSPRRASTGAATRSSNAHIFTGPPAQGALRRDPDREMHMSTETVDGLSLARTFQVKDQSGTIIVALGAVPKVGQRRAALCPMSVRHV